jgi:UTP--glucose-1-phosphate uridylyltransferase
MKPVKKAILPVAGLGTRFLPATKAIPKEMLPIIDKPLVQYAVEEAIDIGVTEIIFITSHAKKAIERHFLQNIELEKSLISKSKGEYIDLINPNKFKDIKFTFIDQNEQKGLGHAISLAEKCMSEEDDAVAILLPDDLFVSKTKTCLQALSDIYNETSNSVIAINSVSDKELSSYGVIDSIKVSDSIYKVDNIIEKPSIKESPSNLAVCGRYILTSSIFNSLKNIKTGAGGEYQLTDAIKDLLNSETVLASTYEGNKFDCGSKKGFVEATIAIALQEGDLEKGYLESLTTFIN